MPAYACCCRCGDELTADKTYGDNGLDYCRDCWNMRGCEDLFDKNPVEVAAALGITLEDEKDLLTQAKFMAGCRVLIDNGIEIDEAQMVLQALCYVMFDTETEEFMSDKVQCCQNCGNLHTVCRGTPYLKCNTARHLASWVCSGNDV